ncbi:MAG TPA: hypothetical protein VFR70_08225 [Flavobacterium sp.]|nr:hypothetical protein [Flavobacterium sp.]
MKKSILTFGLLSLAVLTSFATENLTGDTGGTTATTTSTSDTGGNSSGQAGGNSTSVGGNKKLDYTSITKIEVPQSMTNSGNSNYSERLEFRKKLDI